MAMSRTRSHHQLTSSNSNSNNSSGEDSYSRPPSRGGYNTYAGHHSGQRKNSYTREYVRNLPPASASSAANGGGRGRLARSRHVRDSSPSGRSSNYADHSSYSSQSSDKSDPPAFTVLPTSRSHGQIYSEANRGERNLITASVTADNLNGYVRSPSKPRINTRTYR